MGKILVTYFSASGVTAKIAEQLSEAIGADLHEIRPEVLYTQADLDWRNAKSRSSVEMKDKSFRPAIIAKVSTFITPSKQILFPSLFPQLTDIPIGDITLLPLWIYREPLDLNTERSPKRNVFPNGQNCHLSVLIVAV